MCSTSEDSGAETMASPAGLLDAVQTLAAAEVSGRSEAEQLDELREWNRLRCAVDAAMANRVGAVHARGAGSYDGCPSTKSWMRSQLRMSHPTAGAYVDAAVALPDLPELAAEFTAGRVGLDHIGVLADLRKKAGPEVARIGDHLLKDYALEDTAKELRRLATQVREHFQTDNDDDPPPEPERFLTLGQTLDGVWNLRGALSPEGGAMLRTALDAATTTPAPDDDRSVSERRHDAFLDLIRLSLDSAQLPNQGGEPVHLGVLVPLDDLRGIQARLGHRPPPKAGAGAEAGTSGSEVGAEPGLSTKIAASLSTLDNDPDSLDRQTDPEDTDGNAGNQPLYVPADWMTEYLDPDTEPDQYPPRQPAAPARAGPASTRPAKPPSDPTPDGRTTLPHCGTGVPAGGSALPNKENSPLTQRRLTLPGLGTTPRRLPQPGEGALTDYGGHLTPDAARRLGCDAGIHRVVLGPRDVPLSAGQRTRLVTPALRRILVARDGGCRFPGCDRPPAYTQAHHLVFWANGGPTTTNNLILLCGFHHHRVHDHHWTLTYDADLNTVAAYRPDGTELRLPGTTNSDGAA
jgi:hypothetical protein